MNLCNNDHEEVCYEGRLCPACTLKSEIGDLEQEIEKLREENRELRESQSAE